MKSIWENDVKMPTFPKVESDFETDVLIIGGGICGILCAYMLEKENIDYVLLEADRICSKTTKNTTAKITSLHGLIYGKLVRDRGHELARLYYEANEEAISFLEKLSQEIDCDFSRVDSYLFTQNNLEELKRELETIKNLGIDAEFSDKLDIPFSYQGAIKFKNQAEFNPLKLLSKLAKGLNIYESSRVEEMIDTTAQVNGHYIRAKRVIVTTHFPFINKHGMYFLKMYQHRSYVLAIKNAGKISGNYINDTDFGLSLRQYGEYILLGGNGHRTGKESDGWAYLEEIASKYFPSGEIKYRWATQDCMSLDGVAYIGNYSKSTPNLYVATGFNKWGITTSVIASKILCDLLCGKENRYCELFSPSRSIFTLQLLKNTAETLSSLVSFRKRRYPHLGCALVWNKNERSWDCPCHGSRFEENGRLLDGPANNSLKK